MKNVIPVILLTSLTVFGISFKDVPINHWAYDAVSEVSELGIISGYPDGTFRGVDFVNRYQLAVAIYRTIEYIKSQMKNMSSQSENKETSVQPQVISEIRSSISDLEEKYKMLAGYMNDRYKNIFEKLSSLEKKIRENTLEISKNKSSIDRLNDSLMYVDSRITKIATNVVEISKKVNDNFKHLKSLDDSVDKLEKAYSIFTDYVNDVKEKISVVKAELDSNLSELNDEVNALKKISDQNSVAIKELKFDLSKLSSRTNLLEKSVSEASNSIAILERNVSDLSSKLEDLNGKYSSLYMKEKEDFQKVSEVVKSNSFDISSLKTDLSDLKERVSNILEPELSKTKSDIAELEKRVSNIEENSKTFVKKEVFQKSLDDIESKLDKISKQIRSSSNTDTTQWVVIMMLMAALGVLVYLQVSGGNT